MKINGKYIIQKGGKKIQQKNNLTIFGALQIARLLKRDFYFPKINNKPFGYTKIYDGQYKKISIIDGSDVDYNYDSSSMSLFGNSYFTPIISNQYLTSYMTDDDYSTHTKMSFAANQQYAKTYFDINLKQPVNIGKIGIMARTDCNGTGYNNYSGTCDWTVFFRPQGVHLHIDENQIGVSGGGSSKAVLLNTAGDYLRVYNTNYPQHNSKPYYIMNKIIQSTRRFYCLYYNDNINAWAVKDVTDQLNSSITATTLKTIDEYIFSTSERLALDNNYLYPIRIHSVTEKNAVSLTTSDCENSTQLSNAGILGATIELNYKKINKWIKPMYRLHNYLSNFYDQQNNEFQQKRHMQLISDFGTVSDSTSYNTNTTINYSVGNQQLNQYLSYSCFSFQSISNVNVLYNFNQNGSNYSVELCNENLVGFIPYIDGIRFCKSNNSSYWEYINKPTIFYEIDIFEKIPTPYNPIKIGLSQTQSFSDANSWFVDSIQRVGNNKVVFSKTLGNTQGITYGDEGFKYIGLFGNFDGHLNGTIPADVSIKNSNCFSKAQFAQAWTKNNQQSVVITYQLTIGDD